MKTIRIANKSDVLRCRYCDGSGWEAVETMVKNLDDNYVWYHGYCSRCDGKGVV